MRWDGRSGSDLGPALAGADKAIDIGSPEPLLKLFPASAHIAIRERFDAAIARKNYNKNDVEAGRKYVKAYVEFIHYVEHTYGSAQSLAHDQHKAGKAGGHTDSHADAPQNEQKGERAMELKIPQSLKAEHEELHSELAKGEGEGGTNEDDEYFDLLPNI